MDVLAMSKYKALDGLMNYSGKALKKAHIMPIFSKTKSFSSGLRAAQADNLSTQEIAAEMSIPVFREFIRLIVG